MIDPTSRIERALAAEPTLRFVTPLLAAFPAAELYLVGGAVRDLLLGRPTADFDFVVRGMKRQEIERWFETRGRIDLTGRVFGVYKFSPTGFEAAHPVDIALPRTETPTPGSLGGYRDFDAQSDPALPIEKDLARRDFTVNAFAFDVRSKTLVDAFNGQRDLDGRVIRAVGVPRERFLEDLSRLLRGIRQACQLGFEIDADTWLAIQQIIPEANRTRTRADGGSEFVLPRETVGRELSKALAAHPARAARLLLTSGAFACFLPDVARAASTDTDAFFAPLEQKPSLPVTLALLLRQATPEAAKRALNAAGLSSLPRESALRAMAEDVAWIVEGLKVPPTPEKIAAMPGHAFERTFMNERGGLYVEALNALGKSDAAEAVQARVESIYQACEIPKIRRDEPIAPLVTGADVIALGIAPGPRVRSLLDAVRDAQFDGNVKSRDEALERLKSKSAL